MAGSDSPGFRLHIILRWPDCPELRPIISHGFHVHYPHPCCSINNQHLEQHQPQKWRGVLTMEEMHNKMGNGVLHRARDVCICTCTGVVGPGA